MLGVFVRSSIIELHRPVGIVVATRDTETSDTAEMQDTASSLRLLYTSVGRRQLRIFW